MNAPKLVALTRRGEAKARHITRARILLLADGGASDQTISDALDVDPRTCQRLRKRAYQEDPLTALEDRPRPGAARLLDDNREAHLIALAGSDAPEGRSHWTMQLLADTMVELQIVPAISDETVRRTLKKRAETLAGRRLVHRRGRRRLRGGHGGRPAGLPPAL